MTLPNLSRRSFAVLLAGVGAWLRGGAAFAEEPQAMLLSLLRERPLALGALCRAALPEQSARQLTDSVLADIGFLPVSRAGIAQRIRDDFAEGRVVVVDGWHLSRTEARLCALAAMGRETLG